MRLHSRFLITFLALSLIPLALVGSVAYKHAEAALQEALGLSFQQIAHETADKIDRGLHDVYQDLTLWSDLDVMQYVLTRDVDGAMTSFLLEAQRKYLDFPLLVVLDAAGVPVASTHPALVDQRFTSHEAASALQEGHPVIGDVSFSPLTQGWVVPFAVPIRAKFAPHNSIGVLVAYWNVQQLADMTQGRSADAVRAGKEILVIRNDGFLLTGGALLGMQPFQQNVAERLTSARLAADGGRGYQLERMGRHHPFIVGYARTAGYRGFPGLQLGILVAQDAQMAFAPVQHLKRLTLWTAAGVAILVLGWSLFVAGYVTRPILKIARAASRVVQEDFTARVDHQSSDELGTLAEAFNRMVEELGQQREQLVQKAYVEHLIANLSEMLLVLEPDGRIRTINRAGCSLLGRTVQDLVGRPVSEVVEDVRLLPVHGGRVPPQQPVETHAVARDASRIPVLLSSALLYDAHQAVESIVCVAQNITERKHAEQALRQYAAELARSNEDLEQFAYVASHDLQEPLRMVASYTQLLARRYLGKLDAEADEFIRYASEGAIRMQGLIRDLLDYSRVARKSQPAPLEIGPVIQEALANLHTAILDTRARVELAGGMPDAIRVIGDRSQLIRVFQNLLSNAIKFAKPNQRPEIAIAASQCDGLWEFRISDHGIGIDPQMLGRLFVIFQRLHPQGQYPGTGIGLATCKKIIERHGGRIWVEAQPGEGSTFIFTVPAAAPTAR